MKKSAQRTPRQKYALLAYNANDSAHQKKVGEALIRQQAIYNYSKHEEEALKNAERATTLWRWLFGAFVAIVLIICSTLFLFNRKKRAAGRRIAMMQERYETEKTLLQREMEEMNALLEERQSLLETKEDLMERRDSESPPERRFLLFSEECQGATHKQGLGQTLQICQE